MRKVPFLNANGEVVGTATISEDGLTAEIIAQIDRATMCELTGAKDVSIGYSITGAVAARYSTDNAKPNDGKPYDGFTK